MKGGWGGVGVTLSGRVGTAGGVGGDGGDVLRRGWVWGTTGGGRVGREEVSLGRPNSSSSESCGKLGELLEVKGTGGRGGEPGEAGSGSS